MSLRPLRYDKNLGGYLTADNKWVLIKYRGYWVASEKERLIRASHVFEALKPPGQRTLRALLTSLEKRYIKIRPLRKAGNDIYSSSCGTFLLLPKENKTWLLVPREYGHQSKVSYQDWLYRHGLDEKMPFKELSRRLEMAIEIDSPVDILGI